MLSCWLQVDIVAHSAGGWLARAYLADPLYRPDATAAEAAAIAASLYTYMPVSAAATLAAAAATAVRASTAASSQARPTSLPAVAQPGQVAVAGAAMAVAVVDARPNPLVRSLVTLGAPHIPPALGKAQDMTGGALRWLDSSFPGQHTA